MHSDFRKLLASLGVGAILSLLVWGIVAGAFVAPAENGWVYNFQALIAGTFALVGAYYLHRQIKQSWEIERSRRERKLTSLKAVMPLALADVGSYSRASVNFVGGMYLPSRSQLEEEARNQKFNPPPLPIDAIRTLRELIEFSEPDNIALMVDLLREIQVHNSRLFGLVEDLADPSMIVTEANLNEHVLNAIGIHVRGTKTLSFFRGMSEKLPTSITWAEIRSAAGIFDMWGRNPWFDGVMKQIDKLEQSGVSPHRFLEDADKGSNH